MPPWPAPIPAGGGTDRGGTACGEQGGKLAEVAAGSERGEHRGAGVVFPNHLDLTVLDPVHGVGGSSLVHDEVTGGEAEQLGLLDPLLRRRLDAIFQGRVVEQDPLLEVGQLGRRLDAELGAEDFLHPVESAQRLCLAP